MFVFTLHNTIYSDQGEFIAMMYYQIMRFFTNYLCSTQIAHIFHHRTVRTGYAIPSQFAIS